MTDNEIIKALECCFIKIDCTDCPKNVNKPFTEDCLVSVAKQAIDLINRQKAEIERLRDALIDNEYANCVAVKNGLIYTHTLDDYDNLIGDISAEAIKECLQEVVKRTKSYSCACRIRWVCDEIEKEMVGDTDA